jgi:hypothetical protein
LASAASTFSSAILQNEKQIHKMKETKNKIRIRGE